VLLSKSFGKTMLLCDLNKATLFSVCRPEIALDIPWNFEGISCREYLAGVAIGKYCSNAKFVGPPGG
jgi:hypothetical protein